MLHKESLVFVIKTRNPGYVLLCMKKITEKVVLVNNSPRKCRSEW